MPQDNDPQQKVDDAKYNQMDTPLERALHYVECYAMHFPTSGADGVAKELKELIEALDAIAPLMVGDKRG